MDTGQLVNIWPGRTHKSLGMQEDTHRMNPSYPTVSACWRQLDRHPKLLLLLPAVHFHQQHNASYDASSRGPLSKTSRLPPVDVTQVWRSRSCFTRVWLFSRRRLGLLLSQTSGSESEWLINDGWWKILALLMCSESQRWLLKKKKKKVELLGVTWP